MSGKNKKEKEKALQAAEEREELINSSLKFAGKRFKKFDEIILKLYLGEDFGLHLADKRMLKVRECFSKFPSCSAGRERAILKNVFIHVQKYSRLMSGEDYIGVVFFATVYRHEWIRDLFEWKPGSKRAALQVEDFLSYLFCQYKVPAFMYKAFFKPQPFPFIYWFIHLGTGKSVKELPDMPISFTRRMAHEFTQAPSAYTIEEALRWAQVVGLGGDKGLAAQVAYSWISRKPFGDEEFWESFLRLLINGAMSQHVRLTELIDYVRERKRTDAGYSLKGRSLQSLMRQTDEWHDLVQQTKGNLAWESCGLYGFKVERREELIRMEELTGSKLLAEEGRMMRHCVATYAHQCVSGKTAIFSLRKYLQGQWLETLATVEVSIPTRRIVQAKARMNRKISEEARKWLDQWAAKNSLEVSPYL